MSNMDVQEMTIDELIAELAKNNKEKDHLVRYVIDQV